MCRPMQAIIREVSDKCIHYNYFPLSMTPHEDGLHRPKHRVVEMLIYSDMCSLLD